METMIFEMSKILTDIFNVSFETGKFPTLLKLVKVIPIFKNKDSREETSNYRPISLLSNIDKILEKIVHKRLVGFLEGNNIFFKRQFGFRSKHSTTHSLIALTEKIPPSSITVQLVWHRRISSALESDP